MSLELRPYTTHADQLRHMSDTALADFLCQFCRQNYNCGRCPDSSSCSEEKPALFWLKWLQTQVETDAPEIIHCQDCEHWDTTQSVGHKELGNVRCICYEWSDFENSRYVTTGPDEFCSRGAEKETMA